MATYSAEFVDLLEKDQKDIFFMHYTAQPANWTEVLQVKNSTKAYEERLRVAGLGTFAIKPEGMPIAFSDPVQGTRRRTLHTAYALGYRITREAIEDDQFGILNRMASDLGDSGVDHQSRLAWDPINDGWTGTRHTGLDGLSLFHAAHTSLRPEVASQANTLVPAVELSQAGLESVMTLSKTVQSEEGRYAVIDHKILCIHPENEITAHVLLETVGQPGSANNDINTVSSKRTGMKIVSTPYKTGTKSWSVHAAPGDGVMNNGLVWYTRTEMEFDSANDPDTGDRKNYAYYRGHAQVNDWRQSFGSNYS